VFGDIGSFSAFRVHRERFGPWVRCTSAVVINSWALGVCHVVRPGTGFTAVVVITNPGALYGSIRSRADLRRRPPSRTQNTTRRFTSEWPSDRRRNSSSPRLPEELIALRKIATAIFRGPWAIELGDPDVAQASAFIISRSACRVAAAAIELRKFDRRSKRPRSGHVKRLCDHLGVPGVVRNNRGTSRRLR
jgi:hypothetical protein